MDGLVLTKDEDKAGELNRFFASMFTKEDLNNVPNLEVIEEVEKLDNFDISVTEVDNLLKSIKTDKSPGPDLIHNRVLHETKDIIKVPLTNLFNKSLETGIIPNIWKTANVTPIYKKGCKSDPNNYRPVSLTSTVCKLIEKLVRKACWVRCFSWCMLMTSLEVCLLMTLFADDTKLYKIIRSDVDRAALQNDLNQVAKWSNTWQLPFYVDKCKVLSIGKRDGERQYTMNHAKECQNLTQESEKDLGVTFDRQLKFTEHIENCTAKANQRVYLIRRNFNYLDKNTFLMLYKTLIRPLLEYCNTVWHPTTKKDTETLERVQRKATKLLPFLRDKSYSERLIYLDLPSLVYRRKRSDLLQIYRIVHRIDNIDENKLFKLDKKSKTRGHSYKIVKERANTRLRQSVLGQCAVNEWNNLTDSIVTAENINIFKTRLENYWKDKEWKYNPENHH